MIIEIKNLYKTFGDVKAVQDLSFQVEKGELFAFLGENGAGKSTTISIMCGQLQKDRGTVEICGKNIDNKMSEIANKIGVVFQSSALDKVLTVKDNLTYRAALYGITGKKLEKRLGELDELLNISELYSRTVGKLSGGQRRRVDIARALLQDPEIIILDEPTTGLDPQTRKMLWDAITKMRKDKKLTVFLTTHYMEEAADADHVVILDHGQISAEGTPLELKNKYSGDFLKIYGVAEKRVKDLGMPYEKIPEGYRIAVKNTKAATDLIVKNPELFTNYEVTKGKMDDVFLAVTGKNMEGDNL